MVDEQLNGGVYQDFTDADWQLILPYLEENEKLFGSVTSRDIESALGEEGITIDRRRIIIAEPIKALGVYTVQLKLYGGDLADLKVWVVKE